jgi:NTE family protein
MRAIVLSGGGAKGAAEIGVIDYLLEKEPNLDYDIYTGVSVGALNSTLLASGPLKEEFPKLKDIWLNQVKGSQSVYSQHLWYYILTGIITILFFTILAFISFIISTPKWITILLFALAIGSFYLPYFSLNKTKSIFKTDPLRSLIKRNLDINKLKASNKQLAVGTVSFTTGEYKSIRTKDDDIIEWIMASSSFPVFFPMTHINSEYYTDGGITNIAPLNDAIEMGATEIDLIITSPLGVDRFNGTAGIVKQLLRNIDIMSTTILQDDIRIRAYIYSNVKIRLFIPDIQLTSNSLDFSPAKIKRMFEDGRRIAEKVLKS